MPPTPLAFIGDDVGSVLSGLVKPEADNDAFDGPHQSTLAAG